MRFASEAKARRVNEARTNSLGRRGGDKSRGRFVVTAKKKFCYAMRLLLTERQPFAPGQARQATTWPPASSRAQGCRPAVERASTSRSRPGEVCLVSGRQ